MLQYMRETIVIFLARLACDGFCTPPILVNFFICETDLVFQDTSSCFASLLPRFKALAFTASTPLFMNPASFCAEKLGFFPNLRFETKKKFDYTGDYKYQRPSRWCCGLLWLRRRIMLLRTFDHSNRRFFLLVSRRVIAIILLHRKRRF